MSVTDSPISGLAPGVTLDEADRILIATVDTAIEVGTGRTFKTPSGQKLRVEEIGEKWVHLQVMRKGIPVEKLVLPKKIREVAVKTANLLAAGRN